MRIAYHLAFTYTQLGSNFTPDSRVVLPTLLPNDGTTTRPRGPAAEGDQLPLAAFGRPSRPPAVSTKERQLRRGQSGFHRAWGVYDILETQLSFFKGGEIGIEMS